MPPPPLLLPPLLQPIMTIMRIKHKKNNNPFLLFIHLSFSIKFLRDFSTSKYLTYFFIHPAVDIMIKASKRSQGVSYAIREVVLPARELEKKGIEPKRFRVVQLSAVDGPKFVSNVKDFVDILKINEE